MIIAQKLVGDEEIMIITRVEEVTSLSEASCCFYSIINTL